jgi:hypothetical protein
MYMNNAVLISSLGKSKAYLLNGRTFSCTVLGVEPIHPCASTDKFVGSGREVHRDETVDGIERVPWLRGLFLISKVFHYLPFCTASSKTRRSIESHYSLSVNQK